MNLLSLLSLMPVSLVSRVDLLSLIFYVCLDTDIFSLFFYIFFSYLCLAFLVEIGMFLFLLSLSLLSFFWVSPSSFPLQPLSLLYEHRVPLPSKTSSRIKSEYSLTVDFSMQCISFSPFICVSNCNTSLLVHVIRFWATEWWLSFKLYVSVRA